MPKRRTVLWAAGAAAVLVMSASARAQGTAPALLVSPAEQAARDNDRLRILRDELAQETRLVEEHAKRKAERLAANDPRGVEESEQAQARHAQNIQTLRREIDQALKQASAQPARAAVPVAARRVVPPSATVVAGGDAAPWWDVYARRPPPKVQPGTLAAEEPSRQPAPLSAPAR